MKTALSSIFIFLTISLFAQQEVTHHYDKIDGFHGGVAIVWRDGRCGLISQSGKEIIPANYERISGFGRDAIAYTTKDGLHGLIAITGKVIAPNIYSYIGPFHDFRAITRKNGLEGMIDKNGHVLIENKYEDIRVYDHGLVRARQEGKEVILHLD